MRAFRRLDKSIFALALKICCCSYLIVYCPSRLVNMTDLTEHNNREAPLNRSIHFVPFLPMVKVIHRAKGSVNTVDQGHTYREDGSDLSFSPRQAIFK